MCRSARSNSRRITYEARRQMHPWVVRIQSQASSARRNAVGPVLILVADRQHPAGEPTKDMNEGQPGVGSRKARIDLAGLLEERLARACASGVNISERWSP